MTLAYCTPPETKRPETPALQAAGDEPTYVLRQVALPGLDNVQEAVRTQLQRQHARLRTLEAQSPDPDTLGEAYGLMGKLLLAYDFDEPAETALRNAQHLLPDRYQWPYYLGYLYQRNNDLEAARDRYERVLVLRPNDVAAHVHLAEVYRDLERDADARTLLDKALSLDPGCAAAHYLLGQMAGATSAAIAHYEFVLRLQPDASTVHYPLSLAYRDQGNMEQSREHLALRGDKNVSLADPLLQQLDELNQGPEALLFKGSRLMQQRRFQEAATLFAQATAEDPENAEGYLNLGAALAQVGRTDEAMDALQQSIRLDPTNSKAHFNLGVLYAGKNDEANAIDHFQIALDAEANYAAAQYALSKILWNHGRCREALPHFAAFLAARPRDIEARIHQAVCHVAVGEFAEAKALIETGLEAFPGHPGLQDAMVRILAASDDARVRDGRRAAAIAERLASTIRRAETLESLAMAYAEEERFEEAVQIQQGAVRTAQQQGLTTWVDHLNANLKRYQQHLPCRIPWAPVIFEQ